MALSAARRGGVASAGIGVKHHETTMAHNNRRGGWRSAGVMKIMAQCE